MLTPAARRGPRRLYRLHRVADEGRDRPGLADAPPLHLRADVRGSARPDHRRGRLRRREPRASRLRSATPGWEIVAFDNLKRRGSELNLPRLREAGVEFVHGDVREPDDLLAVGRARRARRVLGRAVGARRASTAAPPTPSTRNLVGAYHCLELARRDGAQVVFLSTSRVYPYARARRARATRRTPTRFELTPSRRCRAPPRAGIAEDFPLEGARTLYGATKLAAELLVAEYAADFGLPAVINRCGVIAGPWQMGKVDQGVFTYWMLAHYFRRDAALHRLRRRAASRCATCCTSTTWSTWSTSSCSSPERWAGATVNVGGGREVSLSLRETTELCRELTGNEVPRRGVCARRARATSASTSPTARGCSASTEWRPRRDARADPGRHARLDRGATSAPFASALVWIGADGASRSSPAPGAWSAPRPSSTSCEPAIDVVGLENDMRASFFGPEASTRAGHRAARRAGSTSSRSLDVDIRDADAVERVFADHRGQIELVVHTAAQPSHDWAACDPQTDFGVNANGTLNLLEATRAPRARRAVRLPLDQQGLRRPAEPAAARGARDAARAARRTTPTSSGIDTSMTIDALAALAVRRLQGRRRPDGAGVRPLLRDADGLLPRRLPDRAQPRRRDAARLPLLPDALHGHRRALHGLRLRRQAGARQHPQRRPGARLRGVQARARAAAPSTTSAAAGAATARCWRRSSSASGSPAASCAGS